MPKSQVFFTIKLNFLACTVKKGVLVKPFNLDFLLNGFLRPLGRLFNCFCVRLAPVFAMNLQHNADYVVKGFCVLGKARFAWKDFTSKIDDCEKLDNYIKYRIQNGNEKYGENRAYYHDRFFHYTKLKNIDSILKSRSFLLSNCGNSNDPIETEIKDNENSFILCFSTGINENLPMWYLYSGVDGMGGCLSFTKSLIYDLVENAIFSVVCEKSDGSSDEAELVRGIDFDITLQDVIYAKIGTLDNDTDIKYNTRVIHKFNNDEFKKFKDKNSAFVKSLIWYYEKETRLLVNLKDGGREKLNKLKNQPNTVPKIRLSFKELPRVNANMKLILAPELSDKPSAKNNFFELLSEYENIQNWLVETSNVSSSEYAGQVKMNLCNKCEYKSKSARPKQEGE